MSDETKTQGGVLIEWDGGWTTADDHAEAEKIVEAKLAEWKAAGEPGTREDFTVGRNDEYEILPIQERLEKVGLAGTRDASPISGSPFDHVLVFLSDAEWDGPFLRISAREEVEREPGYLIGHYANDQAEPTEGVVDGVDTLDELFELSSVVEAAATQGR